MAQGWQNVAVAVGKLKDGMDTRAQVPECDRRNRHVISPSAHT
jgi:hypothetical protein